MTRSANYFIYALLALFFTLLGVFALLFPMSQVFKEHFIAFVLEESWEFYLLGIVFLVIGLWILGSLILRLKKRLYLIRGGHFKIQLGERIFRDHLDRYWMRRFSRSGAVREVLFKKNRIVVTADIPLVPEHEKQAFIQTLQKDLEDLFSRVLGYQGVLDLNLYFGSRQ